MFIRLLLIHALLPLAIIAQCKTCEGVGWVSCTGKEHRVAKECGVDFEHACTTVYRARCCRGILRTACPDCRGAAREIRNELDRRKGWVRQMTKLDLGIGKPMTHVRSEHFVAHCSIEEWRVRGRKKLTRNALTHLVAARLEETAATFEKVVGRLPGFRQDAYLLWDREECVRASHELEESPIEGCHHAFTDSNAMWIGYPFHASLYTDRGLQSYLAHNAAWMLLNGLGRLREAPSWLQIGLPSYIADDAFGGDKVHTHLSSTFHDHHPLRARKAWKKHVRRAASRGEARPLGALSQLEGVLKADYEDHAYAWAYTSFFIAQGQDKLQDLIRQTKKGLKTLDAVESIYGWSPEELQRRWKKHLRKL